MLGSRTNSRRKRSDPAPFVERPTTKMSSFSAMLAMLHTTRTALVLIVYLLDIGFAWSARTMEPMVDLQMLRMPPHAQDHCQGGWRLGHKLASVVLGRD